ncbi:MAG TPA: hypothetical protein VK905_06580, partial [Bacillota bacterium]|nr:hypothetical protein [Bacillota bacterium]
MKLTRILVVALSLLILCSCATPVMPPAVGQPPTEPTPVPPDDQQPITRERDELMDELTSMTLQEKIGQLIFAGYRPDDPTHLETLIREYKIGG